jgi:hypothetical protein
MNHKVFIHKALIDIDRMNNPFERIAIPIKLFPIQIKVRKQSNLNIFERAILSLGFERYYQPSEISEILLLNEDLVKMIVDDLTNKKFYDKKSGTTDIGKNSLNDLSGSEESSSAFLIYDLNRNKFFDEYFTDDDFNVSSEIQGKTKIRIRRDSADIVENISILKLNGKVESNRAIIEKNEKFDFLKSRYKNIISASFIQIENNNEAYLSIVVMKGKNDWYVSPPNKFDSQDIAHGNFVRDNHDKLDFTKNLSDFLSIGQYKDNELTKRTFSFIQNTLFQKPINEKHSSLIGYIYTLFSKPKDFSSEKDKLEWSRKSALAYFDLIEDVFYYHSQSISNENLLKSNLSDASDVISIELLEMAKNIGFNLDESVKKLFFIDKASLLNANALVSGRTIGSILGFLILNCFNGSSPLMQNLAKNYPSFLIDIYKFKHRRDQARHSTSVDSFSGIKIDEELLLFLFGNALGYEIIRENIPKIQHHDYETDFGYAEVRLQSKLGNKEFSDLRLRNEKYAKYLGILYEQYLEKDPSYLSTIRALMEETVTLLLKQGFTYSKPNFLQERLDVYYKISNFSDLLTSHGFQLESLCENQVDIAQPLESNQKLINEINEFFKNENTKVHLSIKLKMLIILIDTFSDFLDIFNFEKYSKLRGLFSIVIAIMFEDKGHHQNTNFYQKDADVLIESFLELIKALNAINQV